MKVEQLARAVVKPVVSRGATVTAFELAPFFVQVGIVAAHEVEDVLLELARDSCEDVDQAVRVRRHEVDRRFTQAHLIHRRLDRLPPATRVARIAEVTAADQPEDDPALVALDRGEVRVEVFAPRMVEALPVPFARSRCSSRVGVVEGDVLEKAMQLVPLDLVGHEGRHQVIDVGGGGDEDREGIAAVVPAAPARKPCGLWPISTRRHRTIALGRRRTAYRRAPMSTCGSPASGCSTEAMERWAWTRESILMSPELCSIVV